MESLSGKVAFVTGGSRGIGLAIARALLKQGAAVAITGTNQDHLDAAMEDLRRDGAQRVLALRADVRRYDDVDAALSGAVTQFGGVDILINNAGVGVFRSVAETTVDEWHRITPRCRISSNVAAGGSSTSAASPARTPSSTAPRIARRSRRSTRSAKR
jgi:NAD(P)-dependent dehydrogenase (short-subunit alcohol dehydrogenase family)